jgi:hypothetical protein
MLPYAIYCCCRKSPGTGLQCDRDRARLLLLVAACAFYASAVSAYL